MFGAGPEHGHPTDVEVVASPRKECSGTRDSHGRIGLQLVPEIEEDALADPHEPPRHRGSVAAVNPADRFDVEIVQRNAPVNRFLSWFERLQASFEAGLEGGPVTVSKRREIRVRTLSPTSASTASMSRDSEFTCVRSSGPTRTAHVRTHAGERAPSRCIVRFEAALPPGAGFGAVVAARRGRRSTSSSRQRSSRPGRGSANRNGRGPQASRSAQAHAR